MKISLGRYEIWEQHAVRGVRGVLLGSLPCQLSLSLQTHSSLRLCDFSLVLESVQLENPLPAPNSLEVEPCVFNGRYFH